MIYVSFFFFAHITSLEWLQWQHLPFLNCVHASFSCPANWVETWFNIASQYIKGLDNSINIYLCCSIVDCVLHENNRWVLSLHSLLVCVGNKRVTALLFYSSLHPSHKCRQFLQFSDLEKLLQRQLFGFPSLFFLLLSILLQLVFNSSFFISVGGIQPVCNKEPEF